MLSPYSVSSVCDVRAGHSVMDNQPAQGSSLQNTVSLHPAFFSSLKYFEGRGPVSFSSSMSVCLLVWSVVWFMLMRFLTSKRCSLTANFCSFSCTMFPDLLLLWSMSLRSRDYYQLWLDTTGAFVICVLIGCGSLQWLLSVARCFFSEKIWCLYLPVDKRVSIELLI